MYLTIYDLKFLYYYNKVKLPFVNHSEVVDELKTIVDTW